jgi:hypothetical protein
LSEKELAGSSDAMPRFGLVRAGLPRPEVLERGCSVQNAGGIHTSENRADFGVFGHTRIGSSANRYERQCDDEQDAVHRHSLLHIESPWQDSQDLMGRQIILAHEPKTAQEPEPDSLSCLSLLYSLESG